jgi:hypothetical protein
MIGIYAKYAKIGPCRCAGTTVGGAGSAFRLAVSGAAVAAIVLAGCGGEGPEPVASPDTEVEAADPLVPSCTEAQIFAPGEISVAGRSVSRIVFTNDGKTAFYSTRNPVWPWEQLVVSRLVRGHWTAPEILPFSGTYFDTDAFVSSDGRTLYFCSDRPVEAGGAVKEDFDIWAVRITKDGFGAPYHLGAEINTPTFSELYPTITRDGTLYFNSDRPGGFGAWDIYAAKSCGDGYEAPENLGPGINTADWEYNPSLTADGNTIVFASNRPTGQASDMYTSRRERGKFAPAWNLGPLANTEADEYHPTLRGNRLYFVRQVVNPAPGDSQFYSVDSRCVLARP